MWSFLPPGRVKGLDRRLPHEKAPVRVGGGRAQAVVMVLPPEGGGQVRAVGFSELPVSVEAS